MTPRTCCLPLLSTRASFVLCITWSAQVGSECTHCMRFWKLKVHALRGQYLHGLRCSHGCHILLSQAALSSSTPATAYGRVRYGGHRRPAAPRRASFSQVLAMLLQISLTSSPTLASILNLCRMTRIVKEACKRQTVTAAIATMSTHGYTC